MIQCLTQKVEADVLIPAIRIELIRILGKIGLSDADISRKLEITKSAVSQYKHKKRGRHLTFPKEIAKEISLSAENISKGKSADAEINSILSKIKKSEYICCVCGGCNSKK